MADVGLCLPLLLLLLLLLLRLRPQRTAQSWPVASAALSQPFALAFRSCLLQLLLPKLPSAEVEPKWPSAPCRC